MIVEITSHLKKVCAWTVKWEVKLKLTITRLRDNGVETLGILHLYDDIEKVFECKTLELPYKNNARNISCIPKGEYEIAKRWSARHGEHLILFGVDGRSYILIHSGNTYLDTEGCILVGKKYADINGDGELDVSSSRQTLSNLMGVIDNKLELMPKHKITVTII